MISDSLRKRMESTVPGPHGGDPRALASVITGLEERFEGQCWVEDGHQFLSHDFFWQDGSLRGDHYSLVFNREPDPWLLPAEFVLQDDEEDEDDHDHDSEHCLKSYRVHACESCPAAHR